jgi:MFS transporter, SHS family, sialic acid transporter
MKPMTQAPNSSRGRKLALAAALLGWMFDGMEMGLFPLVGSTALESMLGKTPEVGKWFGIITAVFLVGAATGGVLFGWLGDKIGRVKAMTVSVMVYALCSGACGFAGAPWHLAVLRFLGALGMGGEWALGVALVMELWPNSSRGLLAGLIGAFGNLGYAIVGFVSLGLNHLGTEIAVGPLTSTGNWRLLMFVGTLPALLTFFIRFFVPESEKWEREKQTGTASHWAGKDLLVVLIGSVSALGIVYAWADDMRWMARIAVTWTDEIRWTVRIAVTILGLIVTSTCYLYPAWQYLTRSHAAPTVRSDTIRKMLLAACLSGVPLLATWGGVMWVYSWVGKLTTVPDAKPITQIVTAVGAAIGCFVTALLCNRWGRRPVYAMLCVASAVSLYGFYSFNTEYGLVFVLTAGIVGFITASFYGWLPLYLPELFRTGVRATGQGFGFNFGRILAAIGSLQTGALLTAFEGNYAKACSVAAGVYVLGFILIWFAPETNGKPLPE